MLMRPLFGIYIILRILGPTQLALTVVGDTGLIGLAVGIAFRDITENFLASIFLSIQKPFENADLIEFARCVLETQRDRQSRRSQGKVQSSPVQSAPSKSSSIL